MKNLSCDQCGFSDNLGRSHDCRIELLRGIKQDIESMERYTRSMDMSPLLGMIAVGVWGCFIVLCCSLLI